MVNAAADAVLITAIAVHGGMVRADHVLKGRARAVRGPKASAARVPVVDSTDKAANGAPVAEVFADAMIDAVASVEDVQMNGANCRRFRRSM